jgi:CHAD domain-containing protein
VELASTWVQAAKEQDQKPTTPEERGLVDDLLERGSVRPDPGRKTSRAAPDLASFLARQRRALLAHEAGALLGGDPKNVHRMRVAARRARAALRAANSFVDHDAGEAMRVELKWLGGVLGAVRDLDVLLARLGAEVETLPAEDRFAAERLLKVLATERDVAQAQLAEALEGERYLNLMGDLGSLAIEPTQRAGKTLESRASREFRKLRRAVAKLPSAPTDEDIHRIRVCVKRARYSAEIAKPVAGTETSRFIKRAKALQDVIGEHQDAVVAADRIHRALGSSRGTRVTFAAGRLVERQADRRRRARTAWPKAWRKLERSGKRAWR